MEEKKQQARELRIAAKELEAIAGLLGQSGRGLSLEDNVAALRRSAARYRGVAESLDRRIKRGEADETMS